MVKETTLGQMAKADAAAKSRGGFCCTLCKFFHRENPTDIAGECRRNAPLGTDTYGRGFWPGVEMIDWCGQGAKS